MAEPLKAAIEVGGDEDGVEFLVLRQHLRLLTGPRRRTEPIADREAKLLDDVELANELEALFEAHDRLRALADALPSSPSPAGGEGRTPLGDVIAETSAAVRNGPSNDRRATEGKRLEGRTPRELTNDDIARLFHETYERLAPRFGYRTREESAKPWRDVPMGNRALMMATVAEVRAELLPFAPSSPSVTREEWRVGWVLRDQFYAEGTCASREHGLERLRALRQQREGWGWSVPFVLQRRLVSDWVDVPAPEGSAT